MPFVAFLRSDRVRRKSKSMVANNFHAKTKNLTAKTKYLTAKPKNLTSKAKYPMAKPKTSRQNQTLHSKNKIALVLPWVFAFAVRYLVFAVKFWFCREGFVVRYFVIAMRFLVLPWGFRFCREVFYFCLEVFGFALTVVGHRTSLLHSSFLVPSRH